LLDESDKRYKDVVFVNNIFDQVSVDRKLYEIHVKSKMKKKIFLIRALWDRKISMVGIKNTSPKNVYGVPYNLLFDPFLGILIVSFRSTNVALK